MTRLFRSRLFIISIIFALVIVSSLVLIFTYQDQLSITALWYGDGTEDSPYLIYSAEQMYNLQQLSGSYDSRLIAGKYFRLMRDITLFSSTYNDSRGQGFTGIFDGNGHSIESNKGGIFYTIGSGGIVKNVKVISSGVVNNLEGYYGVVYHIEKNGRLENCEVVGDIIIDLEQLEDIGGGSREKILISGLVGICDGSIINCKFKGNITKIDNPIKRLIILCVSGICFEGNGIVENCKFEGNIDLMAGPVYHTIYGISSCKSVNCEYIGAISFRMKYLHWLASINRTKIYGLGTQTVDCRFDGDMYIDYQRCNNGYTVFAIAGEGSTYVHNGEIIIENEAEL